MTTMVAQEDRAQEAPEPGVAELRGRLALVQSLASHRLDVTDPNVLALLRAAEGWSIEELAAGERHARSS